jgi:SIR2-like domain
MADFRDELRGQLAKSRAAPFLFVGAGLSRRYLDLDDWESLLRRLAQPTGKPFDYYFASADGDFPSIATLVAEDLHDMWWIEDRFASSRKRFEGKLKTSSSALKAEASIYLSDSLTALPTSGPLAEELELLKKVVVDGAITTNFDPLLEHLFPDFRVFVGQEQLLFEDPQGVGEIYKIHGSHEALDSLVLTRADYDAFHGRNPYLAAKLMTIFVEHPIVFLGYSLTDRNVASILGSIASCLNTKERIERLTDRLIFVQWDKTASQPSMAQSVIPVDGNPIPVMTVTVADYLNVFSVLGDLRRRFPAKLLRQLKEQVYELVLEGDPKDRLYVLPLEPGADAREVELVFGVGAIQKVRSYVGLSRDDLVDDVIGDGTGLNDLRVVQEALPSILSHPGNVPVFKYLRASGLLDDQGKLIDPNTVASKVAKVVANREERLGLNKSYQKAAKKCVETHKTLQGLVAAELWYHVLNFIPALDKARLDLDELRQFLVNSEPGRQDQYRSQWVKMVCLYDWLRYGREVRRMRRRPPRRRPRARGANSSKRGSS